MMKVQLIPIELIAKLIAKDKVNHDNCI